MIEVLLQFSDSKGSFQLRSKEEIDRLQQAKDQQKQQLQAAQWLGGSILDRHAQHMRTSHENIHAAVSASYAMDTMPVRDTGPTSPPPPVISVPTIQVNSNGMTNSTSPESNDYAPVSSNTLLVPDRVAAEYQDDVEDNVQSPPLIQVPSIPIPSITVPVDNTEVIILLPKKRTSLGEASQCLTCCTNLGVTYSLKFSHVIVLHWKTHILLVWVFHMPDLPIYLPIDQGCRSHHNYHYLWLQITRWQPDGQQYHIRGHWVFNKWREMSVC